MNRPAVASRAAAALAAGALGLATGALGLAACGGGSSSRASSAATAAGSAASTPGATRSTATAAAPSTTATTTAAAAPSTTATTTAAAPPKPPPPLYPHLLGAVFGSHGAGFATVVAWRGRPAVWASSPGSGITLLSFDQRLLALRLHSGTTDAGPSGWRYGPLIAGLERRRLVAAFNGGFKLSVGVGGFESYGRTAVALRDGLGSIVTYDDGSTDIGAWHRGVPAPGHHVVSVRQNLPLLVDGGHPAGTLGCLSCWGATLGGVVDPARSALGVTAAGGLIWAGGEHLTVGQLAGALLAAHVVRAVELDINPEWVAAYLYGHRGGHGPLAPVPMMAGQRGIPGQFLAPWSRDFFTIVAR